MFDVILEKYKKEIYGKGFEWQDLKIHLFLWLIGGIGLCISMNVKNKSCEQKLLIISLGVIALSLVILKISSKENKNESALKIKDKFRERNEEIRKFLNDEELNDEMSRKWLMEKCNEKLTVKNSEKTFIIPFLSIIVIPAILLMVEVLLNDEQWMGAVVFTILSGFLYVESLAAEKGINLLIYDRKYKYLEKFRDDLELIEFFEREEKDKLDNDKTSKAKNILKNGAYEKRNTHKTEHMKKTEYVKKTETGKPKGSSM